MGVFPTGGESSLTLQYSALVECINVTPDPAMTKETVKERF